MNDNLLNTTLSGYGLELESIQQNDLCELKALASDPAIWQNHRRAYDQADIFTAEWFNKALGCHNNGKRVVFTIRQNDRVVGSTSYYEISQQHKRLTIGYTWYGPEHWGTSINPTAKLLLMQHAFEQCDFNRVAFCIDAQNTRSLRAVAKLGAQQEGTLHQHIIRADGSIRDSVIYAITHTDWPGIKGRLLSRISL